MSADAEAESAARPGRPGFWAFSGLDGAGKSTQIELLVEELRRRGRRPRRVWLRGGYTPGFSALKSAIRLLRPGALPKPGRSAERTARFRSARVRRAWLVCAMIDLMWYCGAWVRMLRFAGFDVLADRYLEDTELDFQLNFPEEDVTRWWLWRWTKRCAPVPRRHFVFVIPVDESLRRSQLKQEPFPDAPAMLEARLKFYHRLAEAPRFVLVDGRQSRDDVRRAVRTAMGKA